MCRMGARPDVMFDLDDFARYVDSVHERTLRVAACIPEDRVEWAYKPDAFTLADVVRHIALTERYIWAETVHGRRSRYVGHGREFADGRDAVLRLLDEMHAESMALIRALSPDRLEGTSLTPAGTMMTTWKWLRLLPEHEIHHRGQLYTMLGMLGVPTPSLYGLTAAQVQRYGREPIG
jgi:uncharacterized damage-inducible protein DinB